MKGKRTVDEAVEGYKLPAELAGLARAVARRTRLLRREQAWVADEVAAEIRQLLDEGMEAGRVPEALGGQRGDVEALAAAYRKRALADRGVGARMMGGWKAWAFAAVLLPVAAYAVLFVRFHMGEPTIARNFAQEANAEVAGLSEGERAEVVYGEALRASPLGAKLPEQIDVWLAMSPEDEGWAEARRFLDSIERSQALVRRAAEMERLGYTLRDSTRGSVWQVDMGASDEEASENPRAMHIVLEYLQVLRGQAMLLSLHAKDAAARGDGAAVAADVRAILGMTRQVRERPFLISDLVSLAMLGLAADRVGRVIEEYPGVLGEAELRELSEAFAAFDDDVLRLRLDGERIFMLDTLQRVYTDDGNGDGRMTPEGLRYLRSLVNSGGASRGPRAGAVTAPVLTLWMPSRADLEQEWDEMLRTVEAEAVKLPGERTEITLLMARLANRQSSTMDLILILRPAMGSALQQFDEARLARDGVLVAIALERFRLREGRWPGALAELTSEYLAAVPVDVYDGGALKYVVREGRPVVYSVGIDGADDGGSTELDERGRMRDRVLWPRPAE